MYVPKICEWKKNENRKFLLINLSNNLVLDDISIIELYTNPQLFTTNWLDDLKTKIIYKRKTNVSAIHAPSFYSELLLSYLLNFLVNCHRIIILHSKTNILYSVPGWNFQLLYYFVDIKVVIAKQFDWNHLKTYKLNVYFH